MAEISDMRFHCYTGRIINTYRMIAYLTPDVKQTEGEPYVGSYQITPKAKEEQTLETKNKYLLDNINVRAIPFYSVDNADNGQTIIIGDELDYGS